MQTHLSFTMSGASYARSRAASRAHTSDRKRPITPPRRAYPLRPMLLGNILGAVEGDGIDTGWD
jgi:hypothetical protein